MPDLLFYCYAVLTHMVPFLAVLWIRRKNCPFAAPLQFVLPILFGFYVTLVFHVTGTGTLYDALRQDRWFTRINPFPFVNDIDPVGYVLNVVMFLPFGFLVPLLCPENRKFSRMALGGLAFSLLIELSQILSNRGTDVDDLIMNTLGAVAGYFLFRLWSLFFGTRPRGFSGREPVLWISAVFLGRFLLCNLLWISGLLYGS